jgi:hypothetical protein
LPTTNALARINKSDSVDLVDDALGKGAQIVNRGGGDSCQTLLLPTVLHPVVPGMRLCDEEPCEHQLPVPAGAGCLSLHRSGEVTHFIGIQSDVTVRRLAEDGLRQAKQALEHDLRLAARVRQALLPPPEIQSGELRIAHAFHPCDDLAGDGVGIVSLPGGRRLRRCAKRLFSDDPLYSRSSASHRTLKLMPVAWVATPRRRRISVNAGYVRSL